MDVNKIIVKYIPCGEKKRLWESVNFFAGF